MILLDANVCIHYLKGHKRVVARLQASRPRDVGLPTPVIMELEYGSLRAGGRVQMDQLLRMLRHIPFDTAAATQAARIQYDLERSGRPIGPKDLLIAAIALSRGDTLVTNNTREFSRVRGLACQDWTK
jgi:tRNA(fMet)-specific endonuclease VapC